MAQGAGPEIKPWYCRKKKKKEWPGTIAEMLGLDLDCLSELTLRRHPVPKEKC
jgi:hypothetical protein